MREIKNSFNTSKPDVVCLTQVYDVKSWLSDHIPNIHDHLKAHHFRFQKSVNGVTKMFYKEWSTDDYWLPPSGMQMLMENSDARILPAGQPSLVDISFDPVKIEKLESTISKLSGYLEKCDAREWWTKCIASAKQNTCIHGPHESM